MSLFELCHTYSLVNNNTQVLFRNEDQPQSFAYRIADHGYGLTFKRIFTGKEMIDGYTGVQRAMSLINHVRFPDPNDMHVIKLVELPPEHTRLDNFNNLGHFRFDVAYRCTCSDQTNEFIAYLFDIEMQTSHNKYFIGRLSKYGQTLKERNNNLPFCVLAFANYSLKLQGEEKWISTVERNPQDGNIIRVLDDIFCIDLYRTSIDLVQGNSIFVQQKEIPQEGREWLKLLGIRNFPGLKFGDQYLVPAAFSPEINSALLILSQITEDNLKSYIQNETEAYHLLSTSYEDGLQEGRREGRQQVLISMKNNAFQRVGF